MQGIENITRRIQADTQAEVDRILADAQQDADKIRAKYAAKADRETEDLLARGKALAQERVHCIHSAAQMESRKMTLAAKQELIDRAFELALEQLLSLPEEDYISLLADLALQAGSGTESILLNPKDREKLGQKVLTLVNKRAGEVGKTGKFTLSPQTAPIQGGLLLSGGAVEVNCALETLVQMQRTEAAGEVSRLLFP